MQLEADLRTYLLQQLPQELIGANRVYGIVREQASDVPCVVIQRTSTTPIVGLCGTFNLRPCEMQIDSYAMGGTQAWALAKALKRALVDFQGSMGETSVRKVLLTNEFPLSDPDPGLIRVVQLYNFWFLED
jgi:hypothetical protein